MSDHPASRVEQSVPSPDAAKALTEKEKEALEKSGEIEHAHGEQREKLAEEAEQIAGKDAK